VLLETMQATRQLDGIFTQANDLLHPVIDPSLYRTAQRSHLLLEE
jgi:hypothetical protein